MSSKATTVSTFGFKSAFERGWKTIGQKSSARLFGTIKTQLCQLSMSDYIFRWIAGIWQNVGNIKPAEKNSDVGGRLINLTLK